MDYRDQLPLTGTLKPFDRFIRAAVIYKPSDLIGMRFTASVHANSLFVGTVGAIAVTDWADGPVAMIIPDCGVDSYPPGGFKISDVEFDFPEY